MSHSEGKAEVQVSRPGQAFPFASISVPPHPHISQWCRFSVPERLPLKPFRQDRLNRLPLPPSLMATCKVAANVGAGIWSPAPAQNERRNGDIDPFQKILQLEKNLAFVRESHVLLLKGLHEEIDDLKLKNKELTFELVMGVPALPKDTKNIPDKENPDEQQDKIEKLEKEIRKLRSSLKDAMKANSSLSSQLQELKRELYSKHSSRNNRGYIKSPPDSAIDDEHHMRTPSGPSPQMEEYSDTLRQIQGAAHHRGRRDERRHRNDEGKVDWPDNFVRNSNGYHHHHRHHHPQKSPQQNQQQQQPRLPRLPLRNQQNYSHHQYEIQYRQRNSSTLPALKPLVPVVDHRLDKPRKPRGPRPPKMADQAING